MNCKNCNTEMKRLKETAVMECPKCGDMTFVQELMEGPQTLYYARSTGKKLSRGAYVRK